MSSDSGRKIILYSAMSIDGFIADPGGGVEWLEDPAFHLEGEDYGYYELYSRIDTTLMGSQTLKFIEESGHPFPYPDKKNFVYSRKRTGKTGNFEFINSSPSAHCRKLKEQEGKDIWLVGGGQINAALGHAGLINEMILTVIPVIINSGIPLFSGPHAIDHYDLGSTQTFENGFINLHYFRK